ncbi:MAG: recombinase family protein [Ruminococcus flavefaciens]|nr:recombinase family protein [Ruminococcus flavefaciens]MCM1061098.1 recombinase family protein [Eubacterium sp.]
MARNRVIPFCYCMKNGEITTNPKEVYAVSTIFREYLNGSSLLQIAKLMESEKIRYTEDSDHWNKNMVKRIIENEKYLGTDKYPQIIDEDIFNQANEKRVRKATTLNLVCDDLQEIRKVTYCAECGHRLTRIGGNSRYEHWDCRNADCYKFEYRLTDQMIIGAVLTVLNTAIANLSLLESDGEVSIYSPTADIIR